MGETEAGSQATETVATALGPITLSRRGSGPPVLFVHGSPGGFDSSIAMGRFLVDAGLEVLAPSRPGYPGTPLTSGAEIDQQADLLAAMLEALDLPEVGLLMWSGGGPSGYRLAVRHPDMVGAIVAFASVSQAYVPSEEGIDERLMENTGAGNWLLRFMATHMPKSTVSATLKAEGELSRKELRELTEGAMENEAQSDVVLTMARVVGDHANREVGLENDMARFGEITDLELGRIAAPTLVIHGTADTDVPPAHSEHAVASIPNSEFLAMERGTHLSLFVHPDCAEAQARAIGHLRP